MSKNYLNLPLRSLPEALADVRTDPLTDRDIDALARALLSNDDYDDYALLVDLKQSARCVSQRPTMTR